MVLKKEEFVFSDLAVFGLFGGKDVSDQEIQGMLAGLNKKMQARKNQPNAGPISKEVLSLLNDLDSALQQKQQKPGAEANALIAGILQKIDQKLSESSPAVPGASEAESFMKEVFEKPSLPQKPSSSYLDFGTEEEAPRLVARSVPSRPPASLPKSEERTPAPGPVERVSFNSIQGDELYKASLEFLKKLQLPNGGVLATTLEERYPYIYPRDHALVTLAFVSGGLYDEAKKALDFSLKGQSRETGAFPQRWDQEGKDASYKSVQVDSVALVLYAFSKYVLTTNDLEFAEKNWDKIERAADFLHGKVASDKNLVITPSSLHEFPPWDEGYEIWANAATVAAVREIGNVAKAIKVKYNPNELDNSLKEGILTFLWNARLKSFVKNIRIKESSSVIVEADASTAAVSFFETFPLDSDRVKKTIERIETELWHPVLGGICRTAKHPGMETGGHGPWPFYTLLVAHHFVQANNQGKAQKYLGWVLEKAYKNQLPEHLATQEEFEEFVSDYRDAGLLKKDRMVMIENARSHPQFKEGVARISEPMGLPHALFVLAWNAYKKKFK